MESSEGITDERPHEKIELMDTRFWGPSGWKLLHAIAESVTEAVEATEAVAAFFETLPYILPCKFCRASLTDYYKEHPFDPTSLQNLPHWVYTIHNCVNDKLRKQGLHATPNPTWRAIQRHHDTVRATPWKQQLTLFWDFLFSVGYHHPTQNALFSTPMPECPPHVRTSNDPCERNKWNVLPQKDRVHWFQRFWSLLPAVLPPPIAHAWRTALRAHPPTLHTRHQTMNWLWRMRCSIDTDYHDPYRAVCRQIATHSADCRGVTCRSHSHSRRSRRDSKTRSKTRRDRGKKTHKKHRPE